MYLCDCWTSCFERLHSHLIYQQIVFDALNRVGSFISHEKRENDAWFVLNNYLGAPDAVEGLYKNIFRVDRSVPPLPR